MSYTISHPGVSYMDSGRTYPIGIGFNAARLHAEEIGAAWTWALTRQGNGATGDPMGTLNSMDDVSALMRANLPLGMTPQQVGHIMQWSGGNAAARQRIATLTTEELRQAGITAEMADNWAAAYDAIARLTPGNPSAAGRADLMRHAARLLRGK